MSEPTLEDNYARGLEDSDPVYAECRGCDAEYEVNGRYDYYCTKCKEEGK
jgi:Zn finger protein HypA/HybF involved in hydrogenase expression